MSEISTVTTCKGRLAHLKATLPEMVAQGDACEVVVVDYSCPDGTAAWVREHFPAVRLVEVQGETGFHAARARNLGARAASSPWLMFVDADVLLAREFVARIGPFLTPGNYFRPLPLTPDTWGTHLVARGDFLALGGYDEVLRDWGGEDDDLYFRIGAFAGCKLARFAGGMLAVLTHDDMARTRFYDERDRWLSQRANALYLHVKYDLTLLFGGKAPDPSVLHAVYDDARRGVKQADLQGGAPYPFDGETPDKNTGSDEEVTTAPGARVRAGAAV